jgi:cell wall-associated NlpC family hydrolase
LCAVACGSRAAAPVAAPDLGVRPPGEATLPLATALTLLGAPYLDGGSTPGGFDCSGFVQYVFGTHGRRLPRTTGEQFAVTNAIPRGRAQAGDLVFFRTTSRGPSHVGILVDGQRFVHAPSERGAVRVEALALPYWSARLVGFRRVQVTPPPGPTQAPSRR